MSLGMVYAKFCETKTKINKKMPEATCEMLRGMKYNWAYSSKKAIDKLGYKITPLREGLQETVKWYQVYLEKEKIEN